MPPQYTPGEYDPLAKALLVQGPITIMIPLKQGVVRLGVGMGSVKNGSGTGRIPLVMLVEGLIVAPPSRLLPPTVPIVAPFVMLTVVFPATLVAALAAELSIAPHPKFTVTLPANFS